MMEVIGYSEMEIILKEGTYSKYIQRIELHCVSYSIQGYIRRYSM